MGRFAWRNLLTRPGRTILALIGLSIPILMVMGLFSISGGLRNMVGETLSRVEGVMVVRENAPHPLYSQLPSTLGPKLRALPGVRLVAPEVWGLPPNIEGRLMFGSLFKKGAASILDQPVVQGQDIAAHQQLHSNVYPRALKENGEGRFLTPEDAHTSNIVISRKTAKEYGKPDGTSRKPGDTLRIGSKDYHIVGLYETGSMILDVVIVMDIDTARDLLRYSKDTVSSYYLEANDPGRNKAICLEIEKSEPGIQAKSMGDFMEIFGSLMGQVDTFLLMTVSLALLVGVVGIVNTMLMSTSERYVEFGVLRTNGWSQGNVLTLVTLESAFLGLLSGIVGCVLAVVMVMIGNQFISGGVELTIPPWLFALGIGLSVLTGTAGGLYPAWRAARLVPMDAIRFGSR